jgi:signal transduction histidine kinase
MNVSARLILLLTITVSAVMSAATWVTLRQRAATLEEAARDEVRAHAVTLQIALEEDYATDRSLDAPRLIRRMRENTGLYGVFLFDAEGQLTGSSNESAPAEIQYVNEAKRAIQTGESIVIPRRMDGQQVFSVILPIRKGGERIGALEVAAPIGFIEDYLTRIQRDIVMTAALLGVTILLVVLLVTHYGLTRPVRSLLAGALAFGRGELEHRVTVPRGGGEFALLAREFNRMADSLAEQRRRAAREAEERLALERRLRHSENLAMVGRLAAGVAHEMGAPLQVIDGRAKQLLVNPDAQLESRQRNLTIIRSQAERITRIVRQLLNLSRPYHLRLQPTDLRKLLAGIIELVEGNADRADIEIEFQPDEPAWVEADPDLLQQVFLNICHNAVQAMSNHGSSGGILRVEFDRQIGNKNGSGEGSEMIIVRIADTGGGIAPENLSKVFDPFFTTKEIGQGTGLGLAVSNRIIEEHDGWIEAANNDKGGATFSVYLPQGNRAVEARDPRDGEAEKIDEAAENLQPGLFPS